MFIFAVGALITGRVYPVQIALGVDMSGKSKIANLQLIGLGVDQQILWLNITVHNVLRVEIVHCLK